MRAFFKAGMEFAVRWARRFVYLAGGFRAGALPDFPCFALFVVVGPRKDRIGVRVNGAASPAGTQFFVAVENFHRIFLHRVVTGQPDAPCLHLAHVKRVDAFQAKPRETVLAAAFREALDQNGNGALVVEGRVSTIPCSSLMCQKP